MLPGSNVTSAGNPWRGRGLDRAAPFFGLAAILMVRTLGRSCCSALPGELSPTPSAPLAWVCERWCGLAWSKLRLEVDPAAREAVEEIPEQEEAQEKLEAVVEEPETAEAEEAWAVASRRGGRPRRRSRRQRHPTSTRDETAARGTPIATATDERKRQRVLATSAIAEAAAAAAAGGGAGTGAGARAGTATAATP